MCINFLHAKDILKIVQWYETFLEGEKETFLEGEKKYYSKCFNYIKLI